MNARTIRSAPPLLPQMMLWGGLVASALYGALVAQVGVNALYVLLAGAAAIGIAVRPMFGLLLLAVTIPMENLLMVGEGFTATRLLGLLVMGAWLVQKIVRGESFRPLITSNLFFVGGAFILLIFLSILWARNPMVAKNGGISLAQLLVWSLVIVDLCDSWKRLDVLARALVLGAGVAALVTIGQAVLGGMRRAGDDISGGVNGTAVMLLTLLPFSFFVFRSQASSVWRAGSLIVAALSVSAIVLTYSRMNLLLLLPVLLAQYWFTIRGGRGRGSLVLLTAIGVAAGSFFVPWDRVYSRVGTIVPYVQSTLGGGGESQISGRGYHMRVGLAIALDNPLLGVGYGNYGELFLTEYQFSLPGAEKLYTNPRSAHSSFFGIVADLGAVGISIWLLLLGLAVRNVMRAWSLTRDDRDPSLHFFIQGLACALLLHAIPFGFYLPNQKEKILWLLLAMSVIVIRLARMPREGTALFQDRLEVHPRIRPMAALARELPTRHSSANGHTDIRRR